MSQALLRLLVHVLVPVDPVPGVGEALDRGLLGDGVDPVSSSCSFRVCGYTRTPCTRTRSAIAARSAPWTVT